jgi:hypothetical protein
VIDSAGSMMVTGQVSMKLQYILKFRVMHSARLLLAVPRLLHSFHLFCFGFSDRTVCFRFCYVMLVTRTKDTR